MRRRIVNGTLRMQAAIQFDNDDTPFHVTALSAASAPFIQEIEQAVAQAPWSLPLIESEFKLSYSRTYGVRRDSQLVGYIVAHFLAPEAHILNIAVVATMQRQGVGRLLVDTVLNEAIRCGVKKVFLEVRASNLPAIKLYEQLGFKKQGVRKKYYTDTNEDALIYLSELTPIPLRSEL